MKNKNEFAEHLLAQDSPFADEQTRHRDALFRAAKRRLWLEKGITGGVYALVFGIAFLAFLKREETDNLVHVICWGAISLHVLLWFLVYFMWRINALLGKIGRAAPAQSAALNGVGPDRKITIAALILFAFTTLLLVLGFSLGSPVKASQMSVLMLWAPVVFGFSFAFRAASLVSTLWLEHKELELRASRPGDEEY